MAARKDKADGAGVPGHGGDGAEVAEEFTQVVEYAAAIDVAKGSGMVCTRVPGSRPDRRRQKVWQVGATCGQVTALMDHLRAEGIQRLVLESTSRLLAHLAAPRGALLYSRLSREEFGGYSWVRWLTQDPKGEGDNSMVRREALHRIPCAAGRNLVGCFWV